MSYYSESKKSIIDAEIIEILNKTAFDSGSIKNEFKIKILNKNNEYTCVYWGQTGIETGDIVQLKLWKISEDFLLVDSILIIKKVNKKEKQ